MEMIRRQVRGATYVMPKRLADRYDELARAENRYCMVPPRASFLEMRGLQRECDGLLQFLIERGEVVRVGS